MIRQILIQEDVEQAQRDDAEFEARWNAMSDEEKRTQIARDAAQILAPHIQAMLTPAVVAKVKNAPPPAPSPAPRAQWAYDEYSPWARQLAQNYTKPELEKMLAKAEGGTQSATQSHLRAIERTTSMQSNSQARARAGNVVRANYEEKQALRNALEIYDYYPENTKQSSLSAPRALVPAVRVIRKRGMYLRMCGCGHPGIENFHNGDESAAFEKIAAADWKCAWCALGGDEANPGKFDALWDTAIVVAPRTESRVASAASRRATRREWKEAA